MTLSIYEASVPTLVHTLNSLKTILQKGAAHAEAKKIDPAVLVQGRLFPDMFPLSRQVQIATDAAKGLVGRLTNTEPPKFEDTEKTFPELITRVDRTIEYIKTLKIEQFDGGAERAIVHKSSRGDRHFNGLGFMRHWALPNFFFHVTTTYNILRASGVELGKADFLGNP